MMSKDKLYILSSISAESLADIYFQLARMEEAGLSAQQAFDLLNTNHNIDKAKEQLQKYLKLGNSITESGVRSGIFNSLDKDLLNTGEMAGNIGIIYRQLADHYDRKVKRAKKIKSQLYLPSIIFILASFIQPFSALILNEITLLEYFFISFG